VSNCSKGSLHREHPAKPGVFQFIPARCKRFSCPTCAPKKKENYVNAIRMLRERHHLQRHVVLTLDPGLVPEGRASVLYIQQVWARFRTLLRTRRSLSLTYIRTIELQANGTAHFHLLIHETITQQNIIDWWQECGGGHQCRIRFRDGGRAEREIARYVTKDLATAITTVDKFGQFVTRYVTKDLVQQLPDHTRRVATSRGLRLFEPKVKSGWEWSRWPLWMQLHEAGLRTHLDSGHYTEPNYIELKSPPLPEEINWRLYE
jgi:hypothetical protein